jgi:hypothetical protein
MIILGYDPGGGKKTGKGRSGVACLRTRGNHIEIKTDQQSSVSDALIWFMAVCAQEKPSAIGIDTFLHWGTDAKGWRPIDIALRRTYPTVAKSVQPSNSTARSMAVQGMALAMEVKREWSEIALNEAHPKVLFAELAGQEYPRTENEADAVTRTKFLAERGCIWDGDTRCEDEFDAAICCFATLKGVRARWTDLMEQPFAGRSANSKLVFPVGHVSYYWPRSLESVECALWSLKSAT